MWSKLIGPLALACLFFVQALKSVLDDRYGKFVADHFHYLNVTQVGSALVLSSIDCVFACLEVVSCFSFNLAASPDVDGKLWCELLDTDKYNASDKFQANQWFHHFSRFTPCSSFPCKNGGRCIALFEDGSFKCECHPGFKGKTCKLRGTSCSNIKSRHSSSTSGKYIIDPDGIGGLAPFPVFCNMSDKASVGVTVISHDSEDRILVDGCEPAGCYSRDVAYTGASLAQLASLTSVSSHCEQFIKYECYHARIMRDGFSWLVSRDGGKMRYWGGATPNSNKCACGMKNTCADPRYPCNCDANDNIWREDSGLLTHKSDLPVSQLRFGDISSGENGFHTLAKLKCYGMV